MRYLDFVSIGERKYLLPIRDVGDIGPRMSPLYRMCGFCGGVVELVASHVRSWSK